MRASYRGIFAVQTAANTSTQTGAPERAPNVTDAHAGFGTGSSAHARAYAPQLDYRNSYILM